VSKIIEQAKVIYGTDFKLPDTFWRNAFLKQLPEFANDPPRIITCLRNLVENKPDNPIIKQGRG